MYVHYCVQKTFESAKGFIYLAIQAVWLFQQYNSKQGFILDFESSSFCPSMISSPHTKPDFHL